MHDLWPPNWQWRNVDFDAGLLRLDPEQSKSGKRRVFPFGKIPALAELLGAQRESVSTEEREHGAIIPSVFPYGMEPLKSFRTAWRNAVKAAGLPGLRPHDMRRSAARNLVRAGVPESAIMRLCGWSTRSMFDRYSVWDTRDLEDGVACLNGFLEAKVREHAAKLAAERRVQGSQSRGQGSRP